MHKPLIFEIIEDKFLKSCLDLNHFTYNKIN
jgi:hypothetical protein